MLKNVKSTYFTPIIFSFINEGQKLKLIKNNKQLQKSLNIGLINYKFFNSKYIIYEQNRIAKEYNASSDQLIFEGEYLNGQRNGEGKEYQNNTLIFEGNYKNGKRNGKGKQYNLFSKKLIFEGEYLNNKELIGTQYDKNGNLLYKLNHIKGKGKEYDWNDEIKFEGEYLNGQRNGKGKEYFEGKLFFEGEYVNGLRNGKGKEYYENGKLAFEGEYLYGNKWAGKGYDILNNITYELKDGKCLIKEYSFFNGELTFEGEYLYGQKNGKGKEYYESNKLYFEGEYIKGEKNGKGKIYDYMDSKLMFEGEILYGCMKKGKYYIKEKLEYDGEYLYNRKWNGKGYDENHNKIYELINGNGKAVEYFGGAGRFEGEYLNGKKNGKGKEYKLNGVIEFEGEYLNGKRLNK